MHIIEPCCAKRQLSLLRSAIGKNGTKAFEGYGDMSLTELLPALLTRYTETEMLIAAPSIPDQAAEAISKWMGKQWARMDGRGKLDVVRRLTVLADLSREKSPAASGWLRDNPFAGRLVLVDAGQEDTAILLPDFAITGPVNLRYGEHFTAEATADAARVAALWKRYLPEQEKKQEKKEKAEEKPETAKPSPAQADARATAAAAAAQAKAAEAPKKEEPGQEAGRQEEGKGDDQTMS